MPDPKGSKVETLSFRMHPRVLTALGRDLVTNDVVAVIELVKNSYDALATRVDVRFMNCTGESASIEIQDNGHGMTRAVIEDVWCVVATPFRKNQPLAGDAPKPRRVTGDKGLGRLSAARLGSRLEMVTKAKDDSFLRVDLDWDVLASGDELGRNTFEISNLSADPKGEIESCGTRLTISRLNNSWNTDDIVELQDDLARLVSPFKTNTNFKIYLTIADQSDQPSAVKIESPEFLLKPKYAIRGHTDSIGNVQCKYEYRPLREGKPRHQAHNIKWSQIYDGLKGREIGTLDRLQASCGPFEFEIRAWDLASDATLEMSEHFDITKTFIRDVIREHKGISVYRDEILVLPKSDGARDWLGLDLRRVSRVGTRLSTSQIIGYVRITKANNSKIEDTSDRERLASNPASIAFQKILLEVVATLEVERDSDRRPADGTQRIVDLFDELTAEELLGEMVALADEGALASKTLPAIREFSTRIDRLRGALRLRFTYYSRLATIGTIALMLIHEIRNRTTGIGRFLRKAGEQKDETWPPGSDQSLEVAVEAVAALERLADCFAPLASRSFRRGKRVSVLEESIRRTVGLVQGEIKSSGVKVEGMPQSETRVAIDPGELDSILLNLLTNALYWLAHSDPPRRLRFRFSHILSGQRIRIHLDDSGPGVSEEDADRVFWPGVTRKPDGIGMGLTVAAELVSEHGGKTTLVHPGRLGGATFQFDLPIKR